MQPRCVGDASKTGCRDERKTLTHHFCPHAAARSL